jgi:hypothetical protein
VTGRALCALGVGCEEGGACYAERMGEPSRCGRRAAEPAVCGDVSWCGLPAGHDPVVDRRGYEITHAVTADGVYDIPAVDYHQDPTVTGSLSSTGAKRLLPPGCPAKFAHERANGGRPDKAVFDAGRAAHLVVLGVGMDVEVIPTNPNSGKWDTNALKAEVAAARAAGRTPLKPEEWQQVQDMAAALKRHPTAVAALVGEHERAIFWTDAATGVTCRTMLDVLPPRRDSGRLILADYKSAHSVEPDALARAMADFGQAQQAAWCMEGVEALGLCGPGEAGFVFVCQEKQPPYLVELFYPDSTALFIGHGRNRQALRIYAECQRRGIWPGYSATDTWLTTGRWPTDDEPFALALPAWAERRQLEELNA